MRESIYAILGLFTVPSPIKNDLGTGYRFLMALQRLTMNSLLDGMKSKLGKAFSVMKSSAVGDAAAVRLMNPSPLNLV